MTDSKYTNGASSENPRVIYGVSTNTGYNVDYSGMMQPPANSVNQGNYYPSASANLPPSTTCERVAPQPEVVTNKRKRHNGTRTLGALEDAAAALVVTKSNSPRQICHSDYKTYVINPKLLVEWLGEDPLPRLRSSLDASQSKPPLEKSNKQLSGVYCFSFNNLRAKGAAERESLGSTVMTWYDCHSATEFTAVSTTWS